MQQTTKKLFIKTKKYLIHHNLKHIAERNGDVIAENESMCVQRCVLIEQTHVILINWDKLSIF